MAEPEQEKLKSQKPEGFKYVPGQSKYKSEYCQLLIDHMGGGLSFRSFGGLVGVAEQTCKVWAQQHPNFKEAKKIGESMGMLYWEKMGKYGTQGQIKNFNPIIYTFTMKNRFDWTDRTDLRIDATIDDHSSEFALLKSIPREKLLALVETRKDGEIILDAEEVK